MIIVAVWVIAVLTPFAAAAVAWPLMDPREPVRPAPTAPRRIAHRHLAAHRQLVALDMPNEPPTLPDITIPMEPAA